jgi:hypothetical protein
MSISYLIERLESCDGPDRWLDARLDAQFRIGSMKMREPGYDWAWANFPTWAHHKHASGMCGVQHDNGDLGLIWDSLRFTASIDTAVMFCNFVLPGWAWRVATCSVSDDAWVFPDFNSPDHGERLQREFDPALDWSDLTDVDLRPSGRPAIALIISVLKAKLIIGVEA